MLTLALLVSSLPFIAFAPAGARQVTRGFTSATSPVTVTQYASGAKFFDLRGIALGTDGAVWYTDPLGALLLRMTTTGHVTSYPLVATLGTQHVKFNPGAIATGADGLLYLGGTEPRTRTLGVFSPSGGLKVLTLPNSDGPGKDGQVTLGPGGLIWYSGKSHIGSVAPSGTMKTYRAPIGYGPLTQGPDGNVWFATNSRSPVVGSLNPSTGKIHTYPIDVPNLFGCASIIPWNGSLIVDCFSSAYNEVIDLVSTSGNQTLLAGLPEEHVAIQTLVAPSGSLPLFAVGQTLAALDFTHANVVHALLPPTTFLDAMIIGSDGRIWSLDRYGTVDAIALNGPLSSSSQIAWQQFPLTGSGNYADLHGGPDGAMWVSNPQTASMLRVAASGLVTSFKLTVVVSGKKYSFAPYSFATGADGNFYVSGSFGKNYDNIAVVTTSGTVTNLYSMTNGPDVGGSLTPGPDGDVWFTGVGDVGYITTSGTVKTFAVKNEQFGRIVAGTDGNMWFLSGSGSSFQLDSIVPATGKITAFNLPCRYVMALVALPGQVDVSCSQSSSKPYVTTIAVTPSGGQTLYPGVGGDYATASADGKPLFSMNPGGLGILVPSTGEFIQFPSPFSGSGISQVATDASGNVWALDQGAIDQLTLH